LAGAGGFGQHGVERVPVGTMKIHAILFDLDGVLVDATEWHYEALNRALQLFGHAIPRHAHLTVYDGLPTREKLRMLTIEHGFPGGLHDIVCQLKQKFTAEEILTRCNPSFEKEYLVRTLRREGYRLAVCSNAVRESVERMLERSNLCPHLEFFLSNQDVTRPKPDPEIYQVAMRRLDLPPESVLVVEDAAPGVEAARRSGAHVLAVAGFKDVDYWKVRSSIDRIEQGGGGPAC